MEERLWNSRTSDGKIVEHIMVEQWNREGGTVEHLVVEHCNI